MSIVILKTSKGYKEVRKPNSSQRNAESWIVKMMDNDNFVFGYTDNGKFAAVTGLYAEYEEALTK